MEFLGVPLGISMVVVLIIIASFAYLHETNRITIHAREVKLQDLATFCLSVVGFIMIVASLLPAAQSLHASADFNLHAQQLELDKVFMDEKMIKFWPYFNARKRLDDIQKGSDEYNQVIAIADNMLDHFDLYIGQSEFLPYLNTDSPSARAWDAYIDDSFSNSIVLCSRLKEVHRWYTDFFLDIARKPCEKWGILIPRQDE